MTKIKRFWQIAIICNVWNKIICKILVGISFDTSKNLPHQNTSTLLNIKAVIFGIKLSVIFSIVFLLCGIYRTFKHFIDF